VGLTLSSRLVSFAEPVMDFRKSANGGKILRRKPQNVFELVPRVLQAADFDECAAEGHMGRQIGRMSNEAGGAGLDRFFETFSAPVFLGERGEGDRRRVRLDPASQFFNAR
jgi:hypothetical protein